MNRISSVSDLWSGYQFLIDPQEVLNNDEKNEDIKLYAESCGHICKIDKELEDANIRKCPTIQPSAAESRQNEEGMAYSTDEIRHG